MKKFALAAVAAAALSAGVAQAYTVGTFSNGLVVPNVIHNGAASTTAIGLVNQSGRTIPVFWTWFDQESNHGVDGCFAMTNKQYTGVNWSAVSGVGMEGKRGYMVFAVGTGGTGATAANACNVANAVLADQTSAATSGQLAGNAFFVDLASKSVAFTPVIDGPLTLTTTGAANLTTLGADSLVSVAGGAAVAPTLQVSMRYFIDGTVNSGNDTRIAVWSTGNHKGTHTVNIYDSAQNRQSVNFPLVESELSWFDPETIAGRPAAFLDGIIEWNPGVLPSGAPTSGALATLGNGSVVSFSTIIAPSFGAVQTLLGAHRLSTAN